MDISTFWIININIIIIDIISTFIQSSSIELPTDVLESASIMSAIIYYF